MLKSSHVPGLLGAATGCRCRHAAEHLLCKDSKTGLCAGAIKYDDAQKALEQGGFNLSRPEMQQLVSQLVDEMDEQGDIQ